MKYDEFLDRVQKELRLENNEEACRTACAVLETFGERLYATERRKVASELPGKLKEFLSTKAEFKLSRENQDRFTLQEFHNRVGKRAGIGHAEAVKRTEAVMAVLREAVSEGVIAESLKMLPEEFEKKLFGRKKTFKIPASPHVS